MAYRQGDRRTMKVTTKLTGWKEFDDLLKEFPDAVQNRVAQGVTNAGARVIRKEIKAAAPVDADKRSPLSLKHGRLKDNIKIYPMRYVKSRGQKGTRVNTGKASWGYWLEKGTRYIEARPWFLPAFEKATGAAVDRMREYFVDRMEKEIEKLKRKHKP